jgi:hypothetical protein
MLEYIKQQLAAKQAAMNTQVSDPTDNLDETILEFAHLFDDMGELTMEGHNAVRERPILDIPIEDDIELDSMEMSITTNRIMDIPADITAMESLYESQKTYGDFFQEAYKTVTRLPRESESHFVERVEVQAKHDYDAYMEYVIQEGLFGNDMLSINDDRVPASVMVDFGKYSSGNYIAKLPVGFECDSHNKVNINQIHAVTISQNLHVFAHVAEFLRNQIESNQRHIHVRGAVWDIATPKMMIVPAFHGTYTVVVKFEIEGGSDEFVQWSIAESKIRKSKMAEIDGDEKGKTELDVSKIQGIEAPVEKYDAGKVDKMNLVIKNKANPVSEYVAPKRVPSRWGNNDDYEYIEESTRGNVRAIAAIATIGAGATGLAIGLSNLPFIGVLSLSFLAGLGWGELLNVDIRENVDKWMVKSITKDVAAIVKTVSVKEGDEKHVNNFSKFKKANKELLKELEYHEESYFKEVRKHHARLPEEFKKCMRDTERMCTKMDVPSISSISKEMLKDYMEQLEKLMDSMYERKGSKINEYQEEIISLYDVIQEMAETDFIQEAIDFGGGDNGDNPPAADQDATNDNPPAADQNATPNENGDTSGGGTDADAQPSAVNDVSDAVAAKVSNDTNKETADLGMDAAPTFETNPDVNLDLDSANNAETPSEDVNNLEPDTSETPADDMGSTDNFNTPDVTGDTDTSGTDMNAVNDELNSDNAGATDDSLGGGSMENIDDMSIDDLLAKGEEKLKGMSIGQLKDFLNDGLGDETTATEYATEDNEIKNRVNINVRKCLGVLNDSKASLQTIINEFHLNGKKLNNALNDARRSSEFSAEEKNILNKFNQDLNNLSMKFRANPSDKKGLVSLVKEFANGSKTVVNMCEKNGGKQVTMEYAMNCVTDDLGIIIVSGE